MMTALHAFAGYGIELEYMIVDAETLAVRPLAAELLASVAGKPTTDVERGEMGWSNELVMHLIEIKNQRPWPTLAPIAEAMHAEVCAINDALAAFGAKLMPSAMHPWMDPASETQLWSHDIYHTYDRVFGCKTHGWANLQSMHVNLPFADDAEFARLHEAIRFVLPIVPALAASSPVADGRLTGWMDYRLDAYRRNAQSFPSIAGRVVPETVSTRADYEDAILAPMYCDIAPSDPQGILQFEWLNSRGAIARFDRHAIEIRVIDMQECPQADIAIAAAVSSAVKQLYEIDWNQPAFRRFELDALVAILNQCTRDAEKAVIEHRDFLTLFDFPDTVCTAGELWQYIVEQAMPASTQDVHRDALKTIGREGPLARRILARLGSSPTRSQLAEVYGELCDCLTHNRMMTGG